MVGIKFATRKVSPWTSYNINCFILLVGNFNIQEIAECAAESTSTHLINIYDQYTAFNLSQHNLILNYNQRLLDLVAEDFDIPCLEIRRAEFGGLDVPFLRPHNEFCRTVLVVGLQWLVACVVFYFRK